MSFFGSIYADPDLPHRARTVYMYLRDRAGGGSCWPGVKTIARDLHLSPRTVQRALNDLECAGYIQRQRRVPSRFMRKFICRLRLNEVSRQ